METRSSHVLVGAFVLVLVAALFGFVVWIAKVQFEQSTNVYHIFFTGSVNGLQTGSPVRYNGIPVGTVTDIRIDPDNLERTQVTIQVNNGTPITQDAVASLGLQGITGGAYIEIAGGSQSSPPLQAENGKIPVIASRPSSIEQLVASAPMLLANVVDLTQRLQSLLSPENQSNIDKTLANVAALTGTLAASTSSLGATMDDVRASAANLNALASELKGNLGTLTNRADSTLGTVNEAAESLRQLSQSLDRTSEQLGGLVAENRRSIHDFTSTGLYDVTGLVAQLRELTSSMSRITTRLERDPGAFLFGDTRRGLQVK